MEHKWGKGLANVTSECVSIHLDDMREIVVADAWVGERLKSSPREDWFLALGNSRQASTCRRLAHSKPLDSF